MPNQRDQKARPAWSAERLRNCVANIYGGESIVVLANREPFRHDRAPDGGIVVKRSAGGLVTALEPLIQACSGVWVAHRRRNRRQRRRRRARRAERATGDASHYRLRRVWLNADEDRGYYYGFANEGLWPLCHRAGVEPIFRADDFKTYQAVNARFAEAVCEEVDTESPLVLVQDYHFALAPQHDSTPAAAQHDHRVLAHSLAESAPLRHVPVETSAARGTPRQQHRRIPDAGRLSQFRRYGRRVARGADRPPARRHHPRGPADQCQGLSRIRGVAEPLAAQSPSVEACRADIRSRLGLAPDVRLGVGVDRLDYTKGITEKLCAVERLLESHPEHLGRFVFVQIAEPSRHCLPAYRALRSRLWETADRINARFGTHGHRPIVLLEAHHDPERSIDFFARRISVSSGACTTA